MSIYTMYFSPAKSTEQIVTIIGKEFGDCTKIDLTRKDLDSSYMFSKNDICIIGVPSYGGRVPSTALEKMDKFEGHQAKAILVVSYGNRAYDDTLRELQDFLSQRNFTCIGAIAAIAEHSIMHQFAAGRPDAADKKELTGFAKQILAKIDTAPERSTLKLPGNYPYREYHGLPLKPRASRQCTSCGLCAQLCPTGAIPKEAPATTNTSLCITCMRCVSVCPKKARSVSRLKCTLASFKMKKSCSGRKENALFLS